MSSDAAFRDAVGKLRGALARTERTNPQYNEIVAAQPEVLARYQALFSPDGISSLTAEEFRSFLLFRNNRHWWFPLFNVSKTLADMELLRNALLILVDEERPIEERLDQLLPPTGKPMVPYLNRAIITAILLIVRPDTYGVWNSTSENGLKSLGLFPEFAPKASFSERYRLFNEVLQSLAQAIGIDLWSLDSLHWAIISEETDADEGEPSDEPAASCIPIVLGEVQFRLESYLHQFMRDNWESIDLGQEWDLLQEDGETVGFEYKAGNIGYVDLLAKHKTAPRWLVIELKRDQSSDVTVGQILRYMGWVQENLADAGDSVEGLIVARSGDEKIRYALRFTNNVGLRLYEIEFRLVEPNEGKT